MHSTHRYTYAHMNAFVGMGGWEAKNECRRANGGAGYLATLGVTKCPSLRSQPETKPFENPVRKGSRPRSPSAWVSRAKLQRQLAVPRRRTALKMIESLAARALP